MSQLSNCNAAISKCAEFAMMTTSMASVAHFAKGLTSMLILLTAAKLQKQSCRKSSTMGAAQNARKICLSKAIPCASKMVASTVIRSPRFITDAVARSVFSLIAARCVENARKKNRVLSSFRTAIAAAMMMYVIMEGVAQS
eukprot:TRINITY_DN40507_c0_g1_i1.p2 TRINITY_DN40507_c0_g1~~TRINITY_DN40507_c0_g1_i1.p2  ORF type:complete len:141 (-),score=25.82 TRINITY_DN40507_c0_g1_i1:526-948(-)